MLIYGVIALLGTLAGFVSGIVGTGGSIILLPVLSWRFGPQVAIPVMAVASVLSNLSRVIIWRRHIHWRACLVYSLFSIPAAVAGANVLWRMPAALSDLCIGLFFLLLGPLMYEARRRRLTLSGWQLGLCGLVTGFLTGVVFSTGPLTIPIFAGYGLVKETLIATESAASLIVFLTKASTFSAVGALPLFVVVAGLLVGAAMIAGIFVSKHFISRMPERYFTLAVSAMLVVAGISMIYNGLTHAH